MLYDFKSVFISDIFTSQELNSIYNNLNKHGLDEFLNNEETEKDTKHFKNIEDVGYCAFSKDWPLEILNKIKKIVFENSGIKVDDLQIHFARYSKKTGSDPRLLPHFDRFVTVPSLTLSIQLRKTFERWQIYVDDFNINMSENSAILFSGTHQIHFREPKEFSNEDFCDIFVCQFAISNQFDNEHNEKMQNKLLKYLEYYKTIS